VAKGTRSGIALENLKGIGKRVTVRKKLAAYVFGMVVLPVAAAYPL
jgi:hypothetical protein